MKKKKNNKTKIRRYEKRIKNLIEDKDKLINDYHNHLKIKEEVNENIISIEAEIKNNEGGLKNLESSLSRLESVNSKNGSLIKSIMNKREEVFNMIKECEEKFGVEIEEF